MAYAWHKRFVESLALEPEILSVNPLEYTAALITHHREEPQLFYANCYHQPYLHL